MPCKFAKGWCVCGGVGADPFKQRCKQRVTTSEGGGGWRGKPCCVGVYCSVLHCVIVGVLQCVAVCCSVLQCGQHGDGCRGSPGLFKCKCVMAWVHVWMCACVNMCVRERVSVCERVCVCGVCVYVCVCECWYYCNIQPELDCKNENFGARILRKQKLPGLWNEPKQTKTKLKPNEFEHLHINTLNN